jgi:hypothetical protein
LGLEVGPRSWPSKLALEVPSQAGWWRDYFTSLSVISVVSAELSAAQSLSAPGAPSRPIVSACTCQSDDGRSSSRSVPLASERLQWVVLVLAGLVDFHVALLHDQQRRRAWKEVRHMASLPSPDAAGQAAALACKRWSVGKSAAMFLQLGGPDSYPGTTPALWRRPTDTGAAMLATWDLAARPTGPCVLSNAAVKRYSVARTSRTRGAVVLDRAGLERSWTMPGNDRDERLGRVVTSAAAGLCAAEPRVLWIVTQDSLPLLVGRYPHFLSQHADGYAFARSPAVIA